MSEPITSELRATMNVDREYTMGGNLVMQTYYVGRDEFLDHCDAIDAIHANLERENDRLKCELDRVLGELDGMHKTDGISDNTASFMHDSEHHAWAPESHYVMLPKDEGTDACGDCAYYREAAVRAPGGGVAHACLCVFEVFQADTVDELSGADLSAANPLAEPCGDFVEDGGPRWAHDASGRRWWR